MGKKNGTEFDNLMRKLVQVPMAEVVKADAADKRRRDKNRKKKAAKKK